MAFQDPPMLHQGPRKSEEIFSQLCVAWGSSSRSTTTTTTTTTTITITITTGTTTTGTATTATTTARIVLLHHLVFQIHPRYTKLAPNFCLAFSGPGVAWVDLGIP